MARSLDSLWHVFGRLLGASAGATGDHELLDAFVRRHDEAAFAELVRRHGPTVLGVCRRVLRDPHAADDAFQVTFLTLACKASSLRRVRALPAWLHRVAFHVALRVRARGRRVEQVEREAPVMSHPEPAAEAAWRELPAVLDEELQRLPDSLRGPLVLCGLEGKTHVEAARELGWPAGSLSKRLARGRELLRQRLARRGFELAGTAAAAGLIGEATAAVPEALLSATVRGAAAAAAGRTAELSAATAALLREVLDAMFWTRVKTGAVVLLAVIVPLAGLGLFALAHAAPPVSPPTERPARTDEQPVIAKVPAPEIDPEKEVVVLGAKKFRFTSFLLNVAYSPDGKVLAVSDYDRIHLYDAATKEELRTWDAPQGYGIKSLAFSPDSKLLASADQSPELRLWDVATGKLANKFAAHRSGTWSASFSSDGTLLVTAGEDRDPKQADRLARNEYSVRVWDVTKGKEAAAFVGGLKLGTCAAFSPDGKLLAWGAADGKVHVRKVSGGDDLFTHTEKQVPGRFPIDSVDFSTDSKVLAVGTSDVIKLFDIAANKHLKTLAHEPKDGQPPMPVGHKVRVSPDSKTLGSVGGTVALWDVESGKLNRLLVGYMAQGAGAFAFDRNGKKLASVCRDQSVRFWDVAAGEEEFEPGHRAGVGRVAFSPDGKEVLTASHDGVRFWSRATGRQLRTLPKVPALGFLFDRDPFAIVGVEEDGTFHLYDGTSGRDRGTLGKDLRRDMCAALSADGKLLAVGGHGIRVIEVPSGREKVKLPGHGSYTACLAFGPDGKTLVSGGQDTLMPTQTYGVKLWDLTTGKELRTLQKESLYALYRAAYSPDGRFVLTNLQTYDFGSPPFADLATAKVSEGPAVGGSINYPGNLLVFSPDGKWLAVAMESGQLRNKTWIDVWDPATWEKVATLQGHTQRVLALAFSADGRYLVSGGADASAMVWDLSKKGK